MLSEILNLDIVVAQLGQISKKQLVPDVYLGGDKSREREVEQQ